MTSGDAPAVAKFQDDVTASALLIQRVYRGYRTRRELEGRHLTTTNRWVDTLRQAQSQQRQRSATVPASSSVNQAQRNWSHAVSVAKLAHRDSYQPDSSPPRVKPSPATVSKAMDLQYFLEMMDPKHRHGGNLRKYHEHWKTTDSHENFFYWLDHGAGRDFELPACSRERLKREQVRYLSREERFNYLVVIDRMGKFRWARNNELVWTDNSRYEDSMHGILPLGTLNKTEQSAIARYPSRPSSPSSSSSEESSEETDPKPETRIGALNDCRKRAVKRLKEKIFGVDDWWIFVADPSYRLYVGIKKRGSFQHSSFLRGGRIAAAGLIKIREGKLRDLAPLSGHYRPRSTNFHAFVHALQDQGADLSRVSITKLYATLAGMEGYMGTKRKVIKTREKIERKLSSAGNAGEPLAVDL